MSLPSGYTQLEYIQSSGTQYINTGFKPNQDTKISMTADFPPSGNTWLYGGRASAGSNSLGFLYTSGNKYRFDYASSLKELTTKPTGKFTIDSDKNKCYINGELAATATYTTFTSPVNMYIFGNNNNGSLSGGSSAKLYNCSIYDNGVLIRSFVPCKNASGTVGLYDSVNNQFYQNAGTGIFVAGAEVKGSHKTLIDGTQYDLKAGRCLVGGTAYSVKKGRTLIRGTAYEIKFKPSEYTITLTGSGGKIIYNGVEQNGTFTVTAGDSVTIKARAEDYVNSSQVTATISLNGKVVATKTNGVIAEVTYIYTPSANATITRMTESGWKATQRINIVEE